MFLLVEFIDEKQLAVIPSNWKEENKCAAWPPYKSSDRINKAVRSKEQPDLEKWGSYPIRELCQHLRDKRLFTGIEKIVEEQAQERKLLEAILRAINRHGLVDQKNADLPEDITFPIGTIEDMNKLNDDLADTAIFKVVTYNMTPIGGTDPKDNVRRMLAQTVTNNLAEKYNWYGKKGKLAFGNMKLAAILMKVVQICHKTATTLEIEVAARDWLWTAADRDGGRKKRAQMKQDQEQQN